MLISYGYIEVKVSFYNLNPELFVNKLTISKELYT
jgi:hypothetical protein